MREKMIGLPPLRQNYDETLLHHEPRLDVLVGDILQEMFEEKMAGKVRPFVEGEPVGAYTPLPERKPAVATRSIGDLRQEALKLRRRKNQATLRRMLKCLK